MADKPLKSIMFPGLSDRYIIEGLTDEAKEALLACFQNVAWINDEGQTFYDDLYAALYPDTPEPPTPPSSDVLYKLLTPFVSTENNNIDTGVEYEDGVVSVCCKFVITDTPSKTAMIYSNKGASMPNVNNYYGLQVNTSMELWGSGKSWDNRFTVGKYKAYGFVGQITVSSGVATLDFALGNVISGALENGSMSGQESVIMTGQPFIIGNPSVGEVVGLPGTVVDFILRDEKMTSSEIANYFADDSAFGTLYMEIGNIDNNGQEASEPRRIRSIDYLEVSGDTLTTKGCPFDTTWYAYANNGSQCTAIWAARCYNSSKQYIGVAAFNPSGTMLESLPLPSGTKYIRWIMQRNESYIYSQGFSEDVINTVTINGMPYIIKEK